MAISVAERLLHRDAALAPDVASRLVHLEDVRAILGRKGVHRLLVLAQPLALRVRPSPTYLINIPDTPARASVMYLINIPDTP